MSGCECICDRIAGLINFLIAYRNGRLSPPDHMEQIVNLQNPNGGSSEVSNEDMLYYLTLAGLFVVFFALSAQTRDRAIEAPKAVNNLVSSTTRPHDGDDDDSNNVA
eukprot:Clim_evm23s200 gene=Clim_evmTU23s200